jgi:hypothetical protein
VFDDTITEIKQLIVQGRHEGNEIVPNFFFRGRHFDITHFYCFQEASKLDSGIRNNAFHSIFTKKATALGFFELKANNFGKEEIAEARAVIEAVLTDPDELGNKNYKKLVYNREGDIKWQYLIAELHDEFRMCSTHAWKFYETSNAGDQVMDSSNPFYHKFLPRGNNSGAVATPPPFSHRGYAPMG